MKSKTKQRSIIHRYRIAAGHLKKVVKMIEEDEYCIDIVHQSLAVQAALKKADQQVLKNHLETCVSNSIKIGKGKGAIDEIMEVFKKT